MSSRPPSSVLPVTQPQGGLKKTDRLLRWIVVALLIISVIVTTAYTALSIYIATQLVYVPQKPNYATPASLGLQFKYVTFPSRIDQVQLKGWYIPGVLPNGNLTSQRTIIMVHGTRANRTDKSAGLLNLSGELARHGFAILAFDMRGAGEFPPAPLSWLLRAARCTGRGGFLTLWPNSLSCFRSYAHHRWLGCLNGGRYIIDGSRASASYPCGYLR